MNVKEVAEAIARHEFIHGTREATVPTREDYALAETIISEVSGYDEGLADGRAEGYDEGYEDGYNEGRESVE